MTDDNLKYGFEHWTELRAMAKTAEDNMIEVPGETISVGEQTFHVGTFKISKSQVTESMWGKVMGEEERWSRRPVTNVSFPQISDFLQRLNAPGDNPGHLTIPTEAQLLLAQQRGHIRPHGKNKEICLTQFRETDMMVGHHFFDNIPKEEPFDLVVRQNGNREPLPYKQSAIDVGFRLVLVDYYMTGRETSEAIVDALELSEYSSAYKRDGRTCRIYFKYSGDTVKVCPPNPLKACLTICPEQEKEDTIVVSTDVVRLPREMDPDTIMERLMNMNSDSEGTGIRCDAPWLYHANTDVNRVVYVRKELRAASDIHVIAALPDVIKDVLTATAGFNKLFSGTE